MWFQTSLWPLSNPSFRSTEPTQMRRSEFLRAVDDEFGSRAGALTQDLVLTRFGRTAEEALDAGVAPREIWIALCDEADVPAHRRYGVGRREPRS